MPSIKFDSTEIRTTTYLPRFVKHESAPERQITALPLAREDGSVLVAERYGTKRIVLSGILTGTSQANLEANVDSFKELLSRPEKTLEVDWNGSVRDYVATCDRHDFDRDHFHLLFVPWTAEFVVLSGEGKDPATTAALTDEALTTTTPATSSFAMGGSKPARPVITIQGNSFPANAKGIEYKNTDTGERIVVTRLDSWGATKSVVIDCLLKKVTDNIAGTPFLEGVFYGTFPSFKIGTNNVKVSVGDIVNQETAETVAATGLSFDPIDATTDRIAQSFSVPYDDDTFEGLRIGIAKVGTPGTLTWRIETDNGGKPSGTLADAGAHGTVTAAEVSTTPGYLVVYPASAYSLKANTTYWIVLYAAATLNGSNLYEIGIGDYAASPLVFTRYARGSDYQTSTDSGSTYATVVGGGKQMVFKILYGGKAGTSAVKHSVSYTKTYL